LRYSQVTSWYHEMIRSKTPEGGIYIDATMGNGNDTLLFCKMAGNTGKVYAFDIQEKALEQTKELLLSYGMSERARLILDGHEHMDRYVKESTADAIVFNFGYLPGGSHNIATLSDTSIKAVSKALKILKPGAMLCLCVYSGGDTGFEEKEKILAYIKKLPPKEYTVIVNQYYNRKNNPPLPVFIFKETIPSAYKGRISLVH
jgi:ubiquinone/menaquinone biosynthesis C-methylase UbiE